MRVVSQSQFDSVLDQAADDGRLVLVDFYADWCGPCKVLGPMLEKMEPDYEGKVDFIKVDTDRNQALSQAFGIRSLPTTLLLKPNEEGGAEVVGYAIGVKPPQALTKMIDKAVRKAEAAEQGGGGVVGWLKSKFA